MTCSSNVVSLTTDAPRQPRLHDLRHSIRRPQTAGLVPGRPGYQRPAGVAGHLYGPPGYPLHPRLCATHGRITRTGQWPLSPPLPTTPHHSRESPHDIRTPSPTSCNRSSVTTCPCKGACRATPSPPIATPLSCYCSAMWPTSLKKPLDGLDVEDLTAACAVLGFLDHVQQQRGCSAKTRNARLAAIRGLFAFIGRQQPELLSQCRQIRAIPLKRTSAGARRLPRRNRTAGPDGCGRPQCTHRRARPGTAVAALQYRRPGQRDRGTGPQPSTFKRAALKSIFRARATNIAPVPYGPRRLPH